jgi:hypothetical protein
MKGSKKNSHFHLVKKKFQKRTKSVKKVSKLIEKDFKMIKIEGI